MMNENYMNERTSVSYQSHADDSFPDLKASEQKRLPLGKYGRMRRTYLKEQFPAKYNWMVWQSTLWPHLHQIDAEADDLQLKADDQWRWIQEMGNIRNAAEEVVLKEVVYA